MAGENTQTTMEMYKEQYGDSLNNVVPNSAIIYDLVPFPEDDKLGDSWRQSVTLTNEHGFAYGGSSGGLVTLATPVPANIKEGNSSGYEMIGRSRITYAAASRGTSSKKAFKETWGTVLFNLRKASMKRAELSLVRGQMGLGTVSGISTGVITITDATWSPTTWAGMEGAVLEAWTGTSASETQHDTDLTITTISFANKTVTVSGTSSSVAPNDVLYFKGARTTTTFAEGPGIVKIAGNTGSLFGINAATAGNALWAGNTSSSFGTPTMGRYLAAVTQAVEKGLEEKCYLLVPPKAWEVSNADLHANRTLDGSYSRERAANGAQKISYYGQAGELEMRAHVYLQRGESVIFPKSPYKRIGSSDVKMGVPGLANGGEERDVFFHLEDKNAVEARSFSDQSLFCDAPSTSVYISGITYPS